MGLLRKLFGESKRELREQLYEEAEENDRGVANMKREIHRLRQERDEYKRMHDNMEDVAQRHYKRRLELSGELDHAENQAPKCRTCGKFLPQYCKKHRR